MQLATYNEVKELLSLKRGVPVIVRLEYSDASSLDVPTRFRGTWDHDYVYRDNEHSVVILSDCNLDNRRANVLLKVSEIIEIAIDEDREREQQACEAGIERSMPARDREE